MFAKLLIANRGEVALRLIRACRELGIATVVAYSEADRQSLPVALADEAVCIGPAASEKSYLNIPNVVSAAVVTGCDALHPGYGFLAENAYLAEVCEQCGLTFVGPPSRIIRLFGDKVLARRTMAQAGVPVIPGTDEVVHSLLSARAEARALGYPLMIKAVAGGGGRGMRIARDEAELERSFLVAQREAQAHFGSGDLYLERLIEGARHIEVQLLADRYGTVAHLGERDCSSQRRQQKIVEECPSPKLTPSQRAVMADRAIRGAKSAGLQVVGTMEFLMDQDGNSHFLEMNPRMQVEHPVTEMVTGIDLVKEQIRLAAGETLGFSQEEVRWHGHALECRVTAEDPEDGLAPASGSIEAFHAPGGPGIRVDSHLYSGYVAPPFYDSLLAKIVAWGRDRDEAITRMTRALAELLIQGVKTNVPYLQALITHDRFRQGHITVDFVNAHLAEYIARFRDVSESVGVRRSE